MIHMFIGDRIRQAPSSNSQDDQKSLEGVVTMDDESFHSG